MLGYFLIILLLIIFVLVYCIVVSKRFRVTKSILLSLAILLLLLMIGIDIQSGKSSVKERVQCEFIDVDRSRYSYFVTFREVESGDVFDVIAVDLELPRVGELADFYRYDWANFHWYVPVQDVENGDTLYNSMLNSAIRDIKIFREEKR